MFTIDEPVPPAGNTGVQNTSGVFLDWLACTFLDSNQIKTLANELDVTLDDATKRTSGMMGYTDVWSVFGGWIAYNPDRLDMGIHLELPGKALDQMRLATKMTDVQLVVWLSSFGARFTRLDVALDIYSSDVLELAQIQAAIASGLCVSRWKTVRQYSTHRLASPVGIAEAATSGFTFGSRSSNSYLRIYDKRKERYEKTGECSRDYWIRVELEYKGKNAVAVGALAIKNESLDWFGANLRYYLDIKQPGQADTNRSRWVTASWWLKLTSEVKTRLPILTAIVHDIVLVARCWIRDQVAPTLAFLLKYDGGDWLWLSEILSDGLERMNKKHHSVLQMQTGGI